MILVLELINLFFLVIFSFHQHKHSETECSLSEAMKQCTIERENSKLVNHTMHNLEVSVHETEKKLAQSISTVDERDRSIVGESSILLFIRMNLS